jgi:hypothetical protein
MSVEENIKKWVNIDNQLKNFNEKVKDLRSVRNNTEEVIIQLMEEKKMTNATINISDGKLRFVNTKQTAPLTLKYVEECLTHFIKNEDQRELIMNYIKDNREVNYVKDIKRTYN